MCPLFSLNPVSSFVRHRVLVAVVAVLSVMYGGCSAGLGIWPVPESRIPWPGSKIIPIGEAEGASSDWFFTIGGLADVMDPSIPAKAVREAIQAQGGDMLINYTLSMRATRLPLFLILTDFSFWWVTWTAQGTAAKIEMVTPERGGCQDVR